MTVSFTCGYVDADRASAFIDAVPARIEFEVDDNGGITLYNLTKGTATELAGLFDTIADSL